MRIVFTSVSVMVTLMASLAFAGLSDPATDEQKTLYALGIAISQSLGVFSLNEAELEMVKSGITDGVMKHPSKVELKTFGPKIQQLEQTRTAAFAEGERRNRSRLPGKGRGRVRREEDRVRRDPHDDDGRQRGKPKGDGSGESALSWHVARRYRVRQLRQARGTSHVSPQPGHQMLD